MAKISKNNWKGSIGSSLASNGVSTLYCAEAESVVKGVGGGRLYHDPCMTPNAENPRWREGVVHALGSTVMLMTSKALRAAGKNPYIGIVEVRNVKSDNDLGLTFEIVRYIERYAN
jgi:hypothetical protein